MQREHTRKTILWVSKSNIRVMTDRPAKHGPSGEPWTVHRATDSIFTIILDMIPAVFGKLKDSGFFFDPVARDIETNFIPSLLEKVKTKVRF